VQNVIATIITFASVIGFALLALFVANRWERCRKPEARLRYVRLRTRRRHNNSGR
jgi:hypothetical protein